MTSVVVWPGEVALMSGSRGALGWLDRYVLLLLLLLLLLEIDL